MVAGERRRRRKTRAERGRSGYYRASDGQAVGVEGDADTRPRWVGYCDRRGPRDSSAPTSLSWVAFLSVATLSLRDGGNRWKPSVSSIASIAFGHKVLGKVYSRGDPAPKSGVPLTPNPHNIHPARSAWSKGVASGPVSRITAK